MRSPRWCWPPRKVADAGRRLNIGTGEQTSDRELHTRSPGFDRAAPTRPGSGAGPGRGPAALGAGGGALARLRVLGWKPEHSLADGIDETVRYFRAQHR